MVAREAALAAAKKDGQNKNVGAAARMTLQERLAASIAKSRTGSPKTGETGTSIGEEGGEGNSNGVLKVSEPSSPVRTESPKLPVSPTKIEVESAEDVPSRTETPDISVIPPSDSIPPLQPTPPPPPAEQPQESLPTDSQPLEPVTPVEPPLQIPSPPRTSTTSLPPDTDPTTLDLITQLRNDLSTCEARRVEESQTASTRISSLEQKLKLLSQITHDHSKDVAANPNASSWERKLADREEKLALLLDEGPPPKTCPCVIRDSELIVGEKLAKIELNLTTIIKSLRAKQKEDERTVNTALTRAERAEKSLQETRLQLRKAQEIEKKNTERLKSMYKIEGSNDSLRRDKEAALATITGLQNALQEAEERVEEAVGQVQTEALEQERIANAELREKLGTLSTEYTLAEQRYTSELTDLKARLEREQLTAKTTQSELQTEISVAHF